MTEEVECRAFAGEHRARAALERDKRGAGTDGVAICCELTCCDVPGAGREDSFDDRKPTDDAGFPADHGRVAERGEGEGGSGRGVVVPEILAERGIHESLDLCLESGRTRAGLLRCGEGSCESRCHRVVHLSRTGLRVVGENLEAKCTIVLDR